MPKARQPAPVYERIRQILESARIGVARSVNTTQVVANWLIGREIVEEEQRGQKRAGYGEQLIEELSGRLQAEFGRGFAVRNLETFRQFYVTYPQFVEIPHALRAESATREISRALRAFSLMAGEDHATVRKQSGSPAIHHAARGDLATGHPPCGESWQLGRLHLGLAWTHYRMLLRVAKPEARSFYEIEAIQNNWSSRELERQINSLLYERLALSRDQKGLLRLARKGQEIQGPLDVFKEAFARRSPHAGIDPVYG